MKVTRRAHRPTQLGVIALAGTCALALAGCGSNSTSASAGTSGGVTIGIVELNLSNPFFGTLENATESAAKAKGWKVMKAEAKVPGDSATQVTAIENMIANHVKAIVVDPANSTALNGVVKQARDKGILVMTVNSSLSPLNTADATYATDNLAAGKLIGQWAKASAPSNPHIAMLDFDLSDGPASGRHNGFLSGYGIDVKSPLVAGTALTQGTIDTGQSAMENLLSAHPDINVVYTINEPTAHGAYTAIKNKGLAGKTVMVSVDGACTGVEDVKNGAIGATAMQFPSKMGQMAVAAAAAYIKDGTKPKAGLTDSGTVLITDKPVPGLASQTSAWGLAHCWGPK
ncbi:substrate-binding domain-containing protein [Actinacidiphila oryziradicis]|uniref:Sugar ABC transporter substrate-binding protein n=1 Tax=Actinacidiphila oryziradicis TaxID=2571141 RepID=A0A4U0SGT5_9ACTN|nr:substrate-binding domain-containing protein [Actinacidiphila oryziradicis]TJZ99464.1 sugar ABC transporter substrate-binding protein [Actinacidiphila oryziradicis]